MATLAWQARYFWQSPVNRWVIDTVDPRPGEHTLDLGAGIGPATVLAAGRVEGGSVLAVEPSRLMRTALRARRLFQRGRAGIEVRTGKAEAIPSGDASLDAAWSVNSAHHWSNFEAAVDELRRVLRPGGRVLLIDGAFDHPDHSLYRLMERHDHQHGVIDEEALAGAFAANGFVDATGELTTVAGDPARVVQATRVSG